MTIQFNVNSVNDENRLTTWRFAANAGSPACGSNPGTNSDLESQFIYDGLGRLRERIDYFAGCGGGDWCWQVTNEVFYIYDGMRVIQERDVNNNPTVDFTRGLDLSGTLEGAGGIGGLLARSDTFDNNGNATRHFYYHADGNGNIMCLENTAQTLTESSRYDAFGNLASGSFHEFGFSSKEYFSPGGLYYYGYRWYLPSLQRWLNRDPIEDAAFARSFTFNSYNWDDPANSYRFVANDPNFGIDAQGLTVYVCSRKASWGIGNHTYFYDTSATPGSGCQSCGEAGSSGGSSSGSSSGSSGSSCGKKSGKCPDNNEKGPGDPTVSCSPVTNGPRGKAIMNCCKNSANDGLFIPCKHDCHNAVDRCLEANGFNPPNNPRFGPPSVGPVSPQ